MILHLIEDFTYHHPILTGILILWLAFSIYSLHSINKTHHSWKGHFIWIGIALILFLYIGFSWLHPITTPATKYSLGEDNGFFGTLMLCTLPGIILAGPIAFITCVTDRIKMHEKHKSDPYRYHTTYPVTQIDKLIDNIMKESR